MALKKRVLANERKGEEEPKRRKLEKESRGRSPHKDPAPRRSVRITESKEEKKEEEEEDDEKTEDEKEEKKEDKPKAERNIRNRVFRTYLKIKRLQGPKTRLKLLIPKAVIHRTFEGCIQSRRISKNIELAFEKPKRISRAACDVLHVWVEREMQKILLNAKFRRMENMNANHREDRRVRVNHFNIMGAFIDWCDGKPGRFAEKYNMAGKVLDPM
jgi:hypothetical protein